MVAIPGSSSKSFFDANAGLSVCANDPEHDGNRERGSATSWRRSEDHLTHILVTVLAFAGTEATVEALLPPPAGEEEPLPLKWLVVFCFS